MILLKVFDIIIIIEFCNNYEIEVDNRKQKMTGLSYIIDIEYY